MKSIDEILEECYENEENPTEKFKKINIDKVTLSEVDNEMHQENETKNVVDSSNNDNNDYELKVTGTPQTFGDGAIRNTKEGKGRFDLIPVSPLGSINKDYIYESNAYNESDYEDTMNISIDIYNKAFNGDYASAIAKLALFKYRDPQKGLFKLMFELAKHFEKGAAVYGERNCEQGIPLWSFRDSGLRHLSQYFMGENDENHFIAAIWNMWMAMWTIIEEEGRYYCDEEEGY